MKILSKENTFTVVTRDGNAGVFLKRTCLTEVLDFFRLDHPEHIVLARVDDRLRSLNEILDANCRVEWIDRHSPEGQRAYQLTLCLMLLRAVSELLPSEGLLIDHSIGQGLYCELRSGRRPGRRTVRRLREKMAAFVRADTRIEPWLLTRDQFQAECERMNQDARCLTAGGESTFTLFRSENTAAFLGTPLLPSTGRIQAFGLVPWKGGMILLLPHGDDITILPPFVPYSKLFRVFHEFGDWERILGVSQAADLNRSVATGAHSDLIKIAEGLHEKKVAQIADTIARRRKQLRLILIAGPSSSGKTTFTKRLAIQLRVIGLVPLVVSLDNYFLDRDKTPRNVKGKPDYETLEAVDVPRFYRDLSDLLAGRPVRLPRYDFLNGLRTPGLSVTLPPRQPVLVEGLHALNPRLADALPSKVMYRIYASALTQMNITDHMRFPTSDIRLLRRLVRDVRFRSHPASDTLTAWPMVRRGEERHIFPYQDDCHVVFNSALTYEPAVLRTFAEPLLQRIPAGHAAFPEVLRLLQLLRCFSPISPDEVPPTSILREFIGGSSFKY